MSEPPITTSDGGPAEPVPPPPEASEEPPPKKGGLSFLIELPLLVLLAFVLAILLKTFLVQAFYIPSTSMVPTLEVNDRILVNKVVFNVRDPVRGEVVVFHEEGVGPEGVSGTLHDLAAGLGIVPPAQKDFVKRIIGLPGETVEVRDGVVFIDGAELPEATRDEGGYLQARSRDDFGPMEVPEGEYFLMGDNRPNSADSRSSLGTVKFEELVGRAFVVIWPPGRVGTLPIHDAPLRESSQPDAVGSSRPQSPPPLAAPVPAIPRLSSLTRASNTSPD